MSTDPPYYDNIGYADLSGFFSTSGFVAPYMRSYYPNLFSTLTVPKAARTELPRPSRVWQ